MRTAIVSSSDLDASDLRARRFLPDPDMSESHKFTLITAEDQEPGWEWCIRCGTLRFLNEYITPGPRQTEVVKSTARAKRCPADKRPTWRRSGDYNYYGPWTVIGPRNGVYKVATHGDIEFKRLKDAKAFVEGGCRRSSLRKSR